MDTPLSGHEIFELAKEIGDKKTKIIYDTAIKPNSKVKDIFGDSGHVVLFHKWDGQDIGHWVVLLRQHNKKSDGTYDKKGTMYYFDSFGKPPYNPAIVDFALNNGYGELLYNDKSFQPKSANSCGRYALLVSALNKLNFSPKEIEKALSKIDSHEFALKHVRN